MFGAIIPEPFAIPAIFIKSLLVCTTAQLIFPNVSVVIIDKACLIQVNFIGLFNFSIKLGRAPLIFASGNG